VLWDVAAADFVDRFDEDFPRVAIASGVAGGRWEAFSLERVAQNVEWGTDVGGTYRGGTPVVRGAPSTLAPTIPLTTIAGALTAAGASWAYSDSAGEYLCNHLFYELVWATTGTGIEAGFIHVSDTRASVATLTAGWRVILQAVADSIP
jgi:pyroglutamyl-peptidase